MFEKVKIKIIKGNILYPYIIGIGYLNYRYNRIKRNYYRFDVEKEVVNFVNNVISSVPYYKKIYNNLKITSITDLSTKIGFIDKDIVMNNWEDFQLPGEYKNKIVSGFTGGTSGKPLKLTLPKKRFISELATMYTMWKNIGWHGQTRAVIRNLHLSENQVFKVNLLKKEVIFDGFRNSKEYYYQIFHILKRYNIHFIHAYPSSAYQFSIFLKKEKLDVSFIRGFLCGSEALLPEQKELIQNQLGIKIYHWYGHSEKLVLGGYCKHNQIIHIEPTYGYFELINENGEQINEIGKVGEIVGTTLNNPYMPFIRYRTGDYAEYAGDYCPECNRHLPLLKNLQGRWDRNKIFLKDGSFITTTALNLHSDLLSSIDGIQYIQNDIGKLVVLIIKNNNFSESDYQALINHYKTALGRSNELEIKFVESLQKLPNGKFVNLISKLI